MLPKSRKGGVGASSLSLKKWLDCQGPSNLVVEPYFWIWTGLGSAKQAKCIEQITKDMTITMIV